MEAIRIEKPAAEDESAVLAFIESIFAAGEQWVPGSAGLDMDKDYDKWLGYLASIASGEEEGFVPSEVYIAKATGGAVAGILDVRPNLPKEKEHFGHIGYSVAPAYRRRGVASQLLAFGTAVVQKAEADPVIVCVHADNAASIGNLKKGGYQQMGYYTDGEENIVLIFHHTAQQPADLPMVSNGN